MLWAWSVGPVMNKMQPEGVGSEPRHCMSVLPLPFHTTGGGGEATAGWHPLAQRRTVPGIASHCMHRMVLNGQWRCRSLALHGLDGIDRGGPQEAGLRGLPAPACPCHLTLPLVINPRP